jgi:hypothetical protein
MDDVNGSQMSGTSAYKVRINTDSTDTNAIILLADGALVGVLVELSDECHGHGHGKWAIEAAFGIDPERAPQIFASAIAAANWLNTQLACKPFELDCEVDPLR